MRHYRINRARACQLTTGNTRYRNFGGGFVKCANRRVVRPTITPRYPPRRTRWVQRSPNLRTYCNRRHPGSFVNRLRRTGEYICTQRSRYQMRHYRINMAQACYLSWRTTRFQYLGGSRSYPRCRVRVYAKSRLLNSLSGRVPIRGRGLHLPAWSGIEAPHQKPVTGCSQTPPSTNSEATKQAGGACAP